MQYFYRSFFFFAVILLGLSLWIPAQAIPAAAGTSLSAIGAPASNTILGEGIATWKQLTHRIVYLESENRAWESRYNPEREDRNWWNPLWRSSAEHRLQRSNENSLQIRELEKQRRELEPMLLELSDQYLRALPAKAAKFSPAERGFWSTVDAWCLPLRLQRLAESKTDREHLVALNPELQSRRRQLLEQQVQTAKTLDLYLAWRREQLTESEQIFLPKIKTWQAQLQTWLGDMQPWLTDTKPARSNSSK